MQWPFSWRPETRQTGRPNRTPLTWICPENCSPISFANRVSVQDTSPERSESKELSVSIPVDPKRFPSSPHPLPQKKRLSFSTGARPPLYYRRRSASCPTTEGERQPLEFRPLREEAEP